MKPSAMFATVETHAAFNCAQIASSLSMDGRRITVPMSSQNAFATCQTRRSSKRFTDMGGGYAENVPTVRSAWCLVPGSCLGIWFLEDPLLKRGTSAYSRSGAHPPGLRRLTRFRPTGYVIPAPVERRDG
jgi:hypothetical protein